MNRLTILVLGLLALLGGSLFYAAPSDARGPIGSGRGNPTPVPTATPAPGQNPPASSEPYAGAPECPESLHDKRAWHSLWNAEHGCHYDHEHHADPHSMDDVFGTWYYGKAGGEISHPWQTFGGAGAHFEHPTGASCMENDCKHEGYKWLTLRGQKCTRIPLDARSCVTDARAQAHGIFGFMGAVTRFHSLYVEAKVCGLNNSECGIIRAGGHWDTGKLNAPQKVYVPLPGDHPSFAGEDPEERPYRFHNERGQNNIEHVASWNSEGNLHNFLASDPQGQNRVRVGIGWHVRDAWGEVNPNNPSEPHLYCPDYQCRNNNSEATLFRVWVEIPTTLDGSIFDTDRKVNGRFSHDGYTNRYGDIVTGCTSPSLDCVPFQAINVRVGRANFSGAGLIASSNVDYDISPYWPDGTRDWWIRFPN